ncbi:hypothetical protein PNI0427_00607, partial [Streptococcus pneumoniae PNI0427]
LVLSSEESKGDTTPPYLPSLSYCTMKRLHLFRDLWSKHFI